MLIKKLISHKLTLKETLNIEKIMFFILKIQHPIKRANLVRNFVFSNTRQFHRERSIYFLNISSTLLLFDNYINISN